MTRTRLPGADFTLTCRTLDPYDASIRLLNDAQRMGAELVRLDFAAVEGVLNLTIRVAGEVDRSQLAHRLGRHIAVEAVTPVNLPR